MKNTNLNYLLNMQLLYLTSFSTTMFTATDQLLRSSKEAKQKILNCRKFSGNSSQVLFENRPALYFCN